MIFDVPNFTCSSSFKIYLKAGTASDDAK